jgi:hypothetical protein
MSSTALTSVANDLTVSTIIPTYNRAHLVLRAVENALQHSVAGDEVIVVNDGSSDATEQALAPVMPRIRYYRLANGGPSRARNFAVRHARGDLIAFLDDDDEWLPGKLCLQRQLLQRRPEVLFCFSNFRSRYADGRESGACLFNWGQQEQCWDKILAPGHAYSTIAPLPRGCADFNVHIGNLYRYQMFDDYVLPSSLVVRRERAGAALQFPEDLWFCESWACSSRLARVGLCAYLDCDTTIQHGHAGPRLTDVDVLTQAASRIAVLERQWGRDNEFLGRMGASYYHRLDQERLLRVREFIAMADTESARSELQRLNGSPPISYRLLANVPDAMLATMVRIRKSLVH